MTIAISTERLPITAPELRLDVLNALVGPFGYAILESTKTIYVDESGPSNPRGEYRKAIEVPNGYILSRQANGSTQYAGTRNHWTPLRGKLFDPFDSLADAYKSVRLNVLRELAQLERVREVETLTHCQVSLPLAPARDVGPGGFHCRLTAEQNQVLDQLLRGLIQEGAMVPLVNGKPLTVPADCLRWLLFRLIP